MIFGKFFTAIRAFFNNLANGFLGRDKTSVYRLKIDQAAERINDGQAWLAALKLHVNRLQRKLSDDDRQKQLAQACVDIFLKSGNHTAAVEADLKLQRTEATYNATHEQLTSFSTQYNAQLAAIKHSYSEIIAAQNECEQLGFKLEISKANVEQQMQQIQASERLAAREAVISNNTFLGIQ